MGTFLVLALFAHDGLMASAAHAEPASAAHEHEHERAHQPTTNVAATPDDGHQPGHPTACGVAGTAVPASAERLDLIGLAETASVVSVDLNLTILPWIGYANEPFWPPGTRRALLQVYRI